MLLQLYTVLVSCKVPYWRNLNFPPILISWLNTTKQYDSSLPHHVPDFWQKNDPKLPGPFKLSSTGILKAKQKLGVTFNSDKLGGIDFTKFSKLNINMFTGSEPPKFRGSPNISLTKYQLSVYFLLRK